MSPFAGLVAGGVGWLESRDDNKWMTQGGFNNNNRSRTGVFQTATNQTTQQMFFNELKFSAARSIRTSTIILASFNIIAAFATAVGILCDSYFRRRRNDKTFKFWRNGFTFVPEAEVFPLVLSLAIFIQSFIFAGAQSTGLDSLFGLGCTWLAQIMLPAVFIAPYTQLVFAVEITIRGFRKKPFYPRGKFNVSICLAIIGMLTLANFLIADFDQSPNFCLTSLFWFVSHYSVVCFALLVAIVTIVLTCAIMIFVRLHRSTKVEVTARVAASRMVYYLALSAISNSFMIPFFFVDSFMDSRSQNNNALTLSMVASVVANVSGLMTGGLYLFLKSSTLSTIGPRDKVTEYENRRAKYKITLPNSDLDDDSDLDSQIIMASVAGSRRLRRMDSEATLMSTDKEEEAADAKSIKSTFSKRRPDSLRSNKFVSAVASVLMPKAPEPARMPAAPAGGHMRKRSYSLFPRNTVASKASMLLLPATTYSPSAALKPPPSMGNLMNMRHRRDSSMVSSATVQIGIRLSAVDDMPPLAQTKTATGDNVVHSLDCPHVRKELGMESPKRGALDAATSPSSTTPPPPPPPPAVADDTAASSEKDAKMKTLPPVPKINSQVPKAEPAFTLSPTVYSPNSPTKVKLPSPRGVGFSMPVPKGTTAAPAAAGTSPPRSPPRRRGTGDTTPLATDAKGAWI